MFTRIGLVPLLGLLLPALAIRLGDSKISSPAKTLPHFEDEFGAWSAAPTPPPNPRFAAIALKRQVGGPTCGYYQYNSEAFDCYTNQCATSGTHFGCASSSAAPYTACLERTNTICSKSIAGAGTLCCNYATDFPFCVTALKPITKGTVTTITGVRCGNSRARGTKILLELKGSSTIASSSGIRSSISTRTTSRPLSIQTSESAPPTSSIDSIPATSSSDASSETATETPSPPTSSAPVGAIVGGVIGGLAVLGMSTAAVVWLLVRKRSRNPDHNGGSGGAASMSQPYAYEMGGMGGQTHPQAPAPGSSSDAYKGYYQTNMSVNEMAGSEHPYYSAPTPSASPSLHQQHSRAPSHSPAPMPMTPDDYVMRPVTEMPAINPPGIGNNASELPA
ncbi:hypothetical protein CkaCkLH20_01900 [Colletotrichum karsti]|uniref:Carcinoembryonic antigen-related cell adhesion molecule 1 n=1 Tax=Colletotrichum karsti TaxID=1095194 RepID=A0A9P6LP98_9PEZI|nr:uncharacterized protein CkaCkLH20_01900 [Colletotrichum karsti]KAF9880858.1 hypothetical protein CkaCkLH20_01900 [Colletotrichum karsti]